MGSFFRVRIGLGKIRKTENLLDNLRKFDIETEDKETEEATEKEITSCSTKH